ncbi:MAG: excinuclease ABC subunit UvrC [Candidatus Faecivivens sp.]|nr:excinuclease ABC subunit UvrC [Candidatus Faecivivens sp.]
MNIDELRHKALLLPLEPGCYLMKDRSGEIIYVGKAKALKNRVVSYFRENSSHNEKTKKMVSCVNDFDFIVTGSEFEALVLECSLIKHYRPKYNILLMDDKGYHYIHVTDEPYPRIEAVLQKPQDNGLLIGPYMSAYVVRETAEQVNQVFMLPTCGRKFPQDFRKARPCLNFHIKRCMGLCQGKVSREAYQKIIDEAVNYIRSGNVASVEELENQMYAASDALDFERAARLRDQISAIRKITERQTVILGEDRQMDAWGFAQNGTLVSCVLLKIREGRIADKENFTFDGEGNVPEVREEFIYRYYTGRKDIPKAVVLDAPAEDMEMFREFLALQCGHAVETVVPQRGERKKLSDMAVNNAGEQLAHKIRRTGREIAALEELQKLLGLAATPVYIEAYDISNWGETGRVGGMIVFENGRPLKKDYKRFAIRDVIGQDDYGSMREVLRRRFTRYLDGDPAFSRLPDLVLLDGGKGHVNAVQPLLDEMGIDVPLFGMVKDNRHRTRGLTTGEGELALSMMKSAFTLVTNIQDEVHRYAIAYQRILHKKADTASRLKSVKGIGDVKLKKLLSRWPTKPKMKAASAEELMEELKINEETAKALMQAIADL